MTKKKSLTLSILSIIIVLFIIRVYSLNKNFPQKDKIQTVDINEVVNCDDINIKIVDSKIESIDKDGYPIALISYEIKNTTNKEIDLSDIYYKLSLYSNFDRADIQNINLTFDNSQFNITYNKDELILHPGEKKIFKFNYYLLKDMEKYSNFIYIDNSLYTNEFNNYLDDGELLYKTITLGNMYE